MIKSFVHKGLEIYYYTGAKKAYKPTTHKSWLMFLIDWKLLMMLET